VNARCRVRTVSRRLARLSLLVTVAAIALLVAAPAAFAADGVGIGGPTDDRKVTYWAFGVMVFFTLFVIVASTIQGRLEGRKERVRRELERIHRPDA
jgi:O-antigen/teichoic acid export membrane protein